LEYVFPVDPPAAASYGRDHHDYPATDIFSACGTAFRSPVGGVVLEVARRDSWDPSVDDPWTRGGLSVSLLGTDGVRYYGSHLQRIPPAVRVGVRLNSGDILGAIGRSGNAQPTPCHLHFGISPPCERTGDWSTRRGVVAPWAYLDAWRAGVSRSPAHEVAEAVKRGACAEP
jgi:murein DD-endopeptidase MepM/ murein hydrolase activator NlpD